MFTRKSIIKFIVFPFIGFAFALAYALASLAGYTIRWQSLGSPPEKPERIVAASSRGVWVASASGKLYVASPKGSWAESTGNFPGEAPVPAGSHVRRRPPVIDDANVNLEAYEVVKDTRIYTVYALKQDGSVYVWQDWPKQEDKQRLWIWPLIGALLVLWVELLFSLYRSYSEMRASRAKPRSITEEVLTLPRDRW
jgi:hypothetical protein